MGANESSLGPETTPTPCMRYSRWPGCPVPGRSQLHCSQGYRANATCSRRSDVKNAPEKHEHSRAPKIRRAQPKQRWAQAPQFRPKRCFAALLPRRPGKKGEEGEGQGCPLPPDRGATIYGGRGGPDLFSFETWPVGRAHTVAGCRTTPGMLWGCSHVPDPAIFSQTRVFCFGSQAIRFENWRGAGGPPHDTNP